MRWMKHLSVAHSDPAIATILEALGPEGYGIYWLMLEHVALSIEKDSDTIPSRTHSAVEWSNICHCSARRLRQFCEISTELRLICSTSVAELRQFGSRRVADRLQIDIPKLLKYRDEYSKRSGESPSQDREQSREQKESTTEKKKPRESCDWFASSFWPLWPVKDGKEAARVAAKKLSVEDRGFAIAGVLAQTAKIRAMERPIHASTWLNGRRWEDETITAVAVRPSGSLFPPRESRTDEAIRIMKERAAEDFKKRGLM